MSAYNILMAYLISLYRNNIKGTIFNKLLIDLYLLIIVSIILSKLILNYLFYLFMFQNYTIIWNFLTIKYVKTIKRKYACINDVK